MKFESPCYGVVLCEGGRGDMGVLLKTTLLLLLVFVVAVVGLVHD